MKAYTRTSGTRRYKRLCLIESEGASTEPEYFSLFNSFSLSVMCHGIRGESAPAHLLKRMKEDVARYRLKPGDCAWFVLDRDDWAETEITKLENWVKNNQSSDVCKGMALSNPKFEFWLLLHFEEGNGAETARSCMKRLKNYIPGYDKHLFGLGQSLSKHELKNMVPVAIQRARKRWGSGDIECWPRQKGKNECFFAM